MPELIVGNNDEFSAGRRASKSSQFLMANRLGFRTFIALWLVLADVFPSRSNLSIFLFCQSS